MEVVGRLQFVEEEKTGSQEYEGMGCRVPMWRHQGLRVGTVRMCYQENWPDGTVDEPSA